MFRLQHESLGIKVCVLLLLGVLASCSSGDDSYESEARKGPFPPVSEVVFSGDVKEMVVVPGKGDTVSAVEGGSVPAVLLSSNGINRAPLGDGDSGIVRLSPELSDTLSGRKVTVNIVLRSAAQNGSTAVKALYSRPGAAATSGWHNFSIGSDFSTVTFDYVVPVQPGGNGPDLVSIWADPEGKGRSVEVSSVEIKSPQ